MAANFCDLILENFLSEIHKIFYCEYAKFGNSVYEKVHLDLLKSLFKIKLKAHSQISKKFVDKFCSHYFCAIMKRAPNIVATSLV